MDVLEALSLIETAVYRTTTIAVSQRSNWWKKNLNPPTQAAQNCWIGKK